MTPRLTALTLAIGLLGGANVAGHAGPGAVAGWNRYVAAVEARRQADVRGDGRFLVMDVEPTAAAERRALEAGRLVVERVDAPSSSIDVGNAMVHHWRGAVLLQGVTLDELLARLQTDAPPLSPEVLRARVIERRPSFIKVFLRLQRTKIVTAVYDTEHEVTFMRDEADRASSRSIATRIAELQDVGTPQERERASGEDRGFLWRLNAYWRYQAVPGGVIAECESISLSRDVPFGLGAIAGPIIRSTARESMERTLESLRSISKLEVGS